MVNVLYIRDCEKNFRRKLDLLPINTTYVLVHTCTSTQQERKKKKETNDEKKKGRKFTSRERKKEKNRRKKKATGKIQEREILFFSSSFPSSNVM